MIYIHEEEKSLKVIVTKNVEIDLTNLYDEIIKLIYELTLPEKQQLALLMRIQQIFREM